MGWVSQGEIIPISDIMDKQILVYKKTVGYLSNFKFQISLSVRCSCWDKRGLWSFTLYLKRILNCSSKLVAILSHAYLHVHLQSVKITVQM